MTNAEIQVGEYVKLARNQGINKIISSADDFYVLDKDIADESGFITSILYKNQISEEIINHSFNIIDLIEAGDYVNGYKVIEPNNDKDCLFDYMRVGTEAVNIGVYKDDIKTIVTKEQFKSMEYEVGGEDE